MTDPELTAAWNRAFRRERQTRVVKVAFENVIGLGSGELSFDPFLTVLVGGNGAGKTSLLRVLWAAIGGELTRFGGWKTRLAGAQTTAWVERNKVTESTIFTYDNDGTRVNDPGLIVDASYLDLAQMARITQDTMGDKAQRDALLESLTAKTLNAKELERVGRIVRRTYKAVGIYEVDLGDSEVTPFFEVEEGYEDAPLYGAHSMGLGELAIFIAHWRCGNLARDELVLFDEPEVSVAEASQERLLDEMAMTAARDGTAFVLSTHSSRIVATVPSSSLRVVLRQNAGIQISGPAYRGDALRSLGMLPERTVVCFCEDSVGAALARECLRLAASDLADALEFVALKGKEDVANAVRLRALPTGYIGIGMLDGDARDIAGDGIAYLPSEQCPEHFIKSILEKSIETVAIKMDVAEAKLNTAIGATQGDKSHEWLPNIAALLLLSWQTIMAAAVSAWVNDVQNEAEVGSFVEGVRTAISRAMG